MSTLRKIDMTGHALDIFSDWTIKTRETPPGPPQRVDGMTVGVVTMTQDAPHGGEVHPDGDEFLYVISGRVRVTTDSEPDGMELGPSDGCVVPKGEWHRVWVLEPTQLLHVTPGPNGDHRPPD